MTANQSERAARIATRVVALPWLNPCPCAPCALLRSHNAAQRRLTLFLALVVAAGLFTLWRVWP